MKHEDYKFKASHSEAICSLLTSCLKIRKKKEGQEMWLSGQAPLGSKTGTKTKTKQKNLSRHKQISVIGEADSSEELQRNIWNQGKMITIILLTNLEKNDHNHLSQKSRKWSTFTATKPMQNQDRGRFKMVGNNSGFLPYPCSVPLPSSVAVLYTAIHILGVRLWSLVPKRAD